MEERRGEGRRGEGRGAKGRGGKGRGGKGRGEEEGRVETIGIELIMFSRLECTVSGLLFRITVQSATMLINAAYARWLHIGQ
jgi:hypothetical protein